MKKRDFQRGGESYLANGGIKSDNLTTISVEP